MAWSCLAPSRCKHDLIDRYSNLGDYLRVLCLNWQIPLKNIKSRSHIKKACLLNWRKFLSSKSSICKDLLTMRGSELLRPAPYLNLGRVMAHSVIRFRIQYGPSRVSLAKRGFTLFFDCRFCSGNHLENDDHLFFDCSCDSVRSVCLKFRSPIRQSWIGILKDSNIIRNAELLDTMYKLAMSFNVV